MDNLKLEDACKFKHLDKLKPATREVMVNADGYVQHKLQTAFMQAFNPNLLSVAHTLRRAGFSDDQAVEVIYNAPSHREPKGDEIERAVVGAYDADVADDGTTKGKSKSRWWKPDEVDIDDIRANIAQAGIDAMSEDDLMTILGESPEEADNVTDFLCHFFKGVDAPIYVGDLYHGMIEDVPTLLQMADDIEGDRYDQVLANPMKRKLTTEELTETITDKKGKTKLKYASGGRCTEFASHDMHVITFESDKLTPEEQFAVIAYLAQYLPLVSIVYSGGKSYHATFSLKDMAYGQVLELRVALVNLGGDPAVLAPHQLVRLGGIKSTKTGNKLQRVLWIDPDARSQSVDADKLAELLADGAEEVADDIYYYRNNYWIRDATGEKYIGLNDTNMTRRLRMLGYSIKSGFDGQPSQVDRIKDKAVFINTIDYVSPIAGRSIGLNADESGKRYLISSKNKRADAVEGDCSFITGILEGMLKDKVCYIYAWLKVARQQLANEQFTQGHVLALSGAPGCGKSLTSSLIIQPLLGQSADPTKYLTTDSTFNADLVTSELLVMDDKAQKRTAEAKNQLAHSLKDVSASSYNVPCEPKGVDRYIVQPLWRMLYVLNDDDAALGAFPPIGEGDCNSIGDKVLLLRCHGGVQLPFSGDPHQGMKLKSAIGRGIEAFAYMIDNYEIPAEIQRGECRFGFDEFHDTQLLQTINQDTNERTLLSATDEIFFGKHSIVPREVCANTRREYWQGTALEWSELIRAEKYHGASRTIAGELAYGNTKIKAGKVMARMEKVADGRVIKHDTTSKKGWKIYAPAVDDVEADSNTPF